MTTAANTESVETALATMKAILGADGYELGVAVSDGAVSLDVRATPSACADCLVPTSLFVTMAVDMLAGGGIVLDASDLRVTYPTEH